MARRKTNAILGVIAVILALAIAGLGAVWHWTTWEWPFGEEGAKSSDIVILATNDVHCSLDENVGYAGLSAYKQKMRKEHKYVTLADCGESLGGELIGKLSKGQYQVEVMNQVGYDIAVPGKEEFGYGADYFLDDLMKKAEATYLSSNFTTVKDDVTGDAVLKPYVMVSCGRKKVAYVGISTPLSMAESAKDSFTDKDGKVKYGFCGGDDGKELFEKVQATIDEAKSDGADYVIGVSNLGRDQEGAPFTSDELIKNTKGFTGLFDGNCDGQVLDAVKDKDGKEVPLVSAGSKLETIGKMVINKDGKVEPSLVTPDQIDAKDPETENCIAKVKGQFEGQLDEKIATVEVDLKIKDKNDKVVSGSEETNLGDFIADAYKAMLGADIGVVNGGKLTTEVPKGDLTYRKLMDLHSEASKACLIEATGQQIADALEFGAMYISQRENHNLLQVSGLTYKVNRYKFTNVRLNANGEFVSSDKFWLKVSDIMVDGKPIDLKATYTIAGNQKLLKDCEDGFTMFKDCKVLKSDIAVDVDTVITYLKENLGGTIGSEYESPQGRIVIPR